MKMSQPIDLHCGSTLPNRLAKSAMSEALADSSGNATSEYVNLYERWGRGGAGLLITGHVMVDRSAKAEPGNMVFDNPGELELLSQMAEAAQRHGSHCWVQLNHPGRQIAKGPGIVTVAPSAVPLKGMGGAFPVPRALTHEEVLQIIAKFAAAAEVAKSAGFKGVQIHAAHGYLASQFLSPISNIREDEWGGGISGRMQFLVRTVRAIRERVGTEFPIGVKMNSADFQRGGFDVDDARVVAKALEAEGVDLLELSGGTYERPAMFDDRLQKAAESTKKREAYFLTYAEQIRESTTMPLMLTGGFRSSQGIEAALDSGAIDIAGMARPLAVEPDLCARLLSQESQEAMTITSAQLPVKRLNPLIQTAWYNTQIKRMAQKLDPLPKLSACKVFATFGWQMLTQPKARPGVKS